MSNTGLIVYYTHCSSQRLLLMEDIRTHTYGLRCKCCNMEAIKHTTTPVIFHFVTFKILLKNFTRAVQLIAIFWTFCKQKIYISKNINFNSFALCIFSHLYHWLTFTIFKQTCCAATVSQLKFMFLEILISYFQKVQK